MATNRGRGRTLGMRYVKLRLNEPEMDSIERLKTAYGLRTRAAVLRFALNHTAAQVR